MLGFLQNQISFPPSPHLQPLCQPLMSCPLLSPPFPALSPPPQPKRRPSHQDCFPPRSPVSVHQPASPHQKERACVHPPPELRRAGPRRATPCPTWLRGLPSHGPFCHLLRCPEPAAGFLPPFLQRPLASTSIFQTRSPPEQPSKSTMPGKVTEIQCIQPNSRKRVDLM